MAAGISFYSGIRVLVDWWRGNRPVYFGDFSINWNCLLHTSMPHMLVCTLCTMCSSCLHCPNGDLSILILLLEMGTYSRKSRLNSTTWRNHECSNEYLPKRCSHTGNSVSSLKLELRKQIYSESSQLYIHKIVVHRFLVGFIVQRSWARPHILILCLQRARHACIFKGAI